MAETIRMTNKLKSVAKAFRELYKDTKWIQDMSDPEVINAVCSEWVRQNYTHIEANEILK